MGITDRLARLAAGAPVPVFAVAGAGAREAVQDLRLSPELRLVETPRAATVLLLAGAIPESLGEPLARVHDGMPRPRATVWWALGADAPPAGFPDAVSAGDDVVDWIVGVHRDLLDGRRSSEPALLPDVEPAIWMGIGPYGQGGSGMTGGTPYGRPMAQLASDRDGLRLDQLVLSVGPFFPRFPAGLVLELKLSGDVVQEASARPNPFAQATMTELALRPGLRPFFRAIDEPVSVAELELARAREHLRWLADALLAHELPALGLRVLRLAQRLRPGDARDVRRLAGRLDWTQVFRWSTEGVGVLSGEFIEGLGVGPVARAAGLAEDARIGDPVYCELGFAPVLQQRGDAAARWRQRLLEAAQSLEIAAHAGDRMIGPVSAIESPRGRLEPGSVPTDRLLPVLPAFVEGLEWGDAVATIVSLDLDLEEAAAAMRLVPKPVRS